MRQVGTSILLALTGLHLHASDAAADDLDVGKIETGLTDVYAIWGSSPTDLYVVGPKGTLDHSEDGGATWQALANKTIGQADLVAIWGSGPDDIYVVGGSKIFRSTDHGKTWKAQRSGVSTKLFRVWGTGPNDVYVVGAKGVVLHSTDSGKRWTATKSGTKAELSRIWGSGPNDVFVVGDGGTILHSTDGGASWTASKSGSHDAFTGVWGDGKGNVYVSAHDGGSLASTDGGKTWDKDGVGKETQWAIAGMSTGDAYLVLGGGNIVHRAPGATSYDDPDEDAFDTNRTGKATKHYAATFDQEVGDAWCIETTCFFMPVDGGTIIRVAKP